MTPAEQLAKDKGPRRPPSEPARTKQFSCKIREKRNALNLSLRDVGAATGVSANSLLLIEQGYGPTLKTALHLARFFGVSVEELWEPLEQ